MVLVFLPSAITVLALNGGFFFSVGQIVALVLLVGIAGSVFFTLLSVYKDSVFAFMALVVMSGFFLFLVTDNYSPMVFGGQDPGYYTAFSRVLSESLGSPFDSSGFELTSRSVLPSAKTKNGLSEIEFYPMLPAVLASIEWVFGKYSYVVLGAASAFVVMTVIVRGFEKTPISVRVLLSGLWFFMPATIWFSRTPSSEIVSVPILAIALALSFLKIHDYRRMTMMIFLLSLALLLARANPLLLVLVAVAGFHHSRPLWPAQTIIKRLLIVALPIFLAILVGFGFYWRHLPTFTEIIFIDIYGPHLDFAAGVLGFGVCIGTLWYLASKRLGFGAPLILKNSTRKYVNYALAICALTLLFISTALVLFTDEWGVYSPSVFGIGELFVQRFDKTPVVFLVTSFGLSLMLVRAKVHDFNGMLLTALVVSLVFATIRNPGVPMTYFYERYWWSEIALILLFLIAGSLTFKTTKVLFLRFTSLILVLSSFVNVVVFDRTITELTEGVSERDLMGLVEKINDLGSREIFFVDTEAYGWLSQYVVPLRYSFGLRLTGINDTSPQPPPGSLLLSPRPCQVNQELIGHLMTSPRLSKFSEQGLGSWVRYETIVFVCNLVVD
jgi:hypothetical protein